MVLGGGKAPKEKSYFLFPACAVGSHVTWESHCTSQTFYPRGAFRRAEQGAWNTLSRGKHVVGAQQMTKPSWPVTGPHGLQVREILVK